MLRIQIVKCTYTNRLLAADGSVNTSAQISLYMGIKTFFKLNIHKYNSALKDGEKGQYNGLLYLWHHHKKNYKMKMFILSWVQQGHKMQDIKQRSQDERGTQFN